MSSDREFFVHPTATVAPGARIGAGTKIWHYCHVMSGAQLGERCVLGQNVFVAATAVIGDRVKIQNNVSIYDGVVLEDEVFCGPSMVFTNVINPRAFIERKSAYRATLVRRGATLGANCTILCGNTIGEYSLVGAGAVVTHDLPAFVLACGVPAVAHGWVCYCGVTLARETDRASDLGTCRGEISDDQILGDRLPVLESSGAQTRNAEAAGVQASSMPAASRQGWSVQASSLAISGAEDRWSCPSCGARYAAALAGADVLQSGGPGLRRLREDEP